MVKSVALSSPLLRSAPSAGSRRLNSTPLRGCVCIASLPPPPIKHTISSKQQVTVSNRTSPLIDILSSFEEEDAEEEKDYRRVSALDIVDARLKWLGFFSVGLILSAYVVQDFDELLSKHVELSFFLPLIIGYAGNSGSQTTCAIIRALALKQVSFKHVLGIVLKESIAGAIMGFVLGGAIFVLSQVTHSVSSEVGLCVFASLPVVSIWSNALGAFLTLGAAKLKLDAALTAAPLMTTIVDTTGLVIYFVISDHVIRADWYGVTAAQAMSLIMSVPVLITGGAAQ